MSEVAPSRFDAGRVVGISLGVFRRRWRAILPLVLAVWTIAVGQNLAHVAQYKHGSHDLGAFADYWAFAIAFVCVGWLKDAAIVAAALQAPDDPRPLIHALQGALRVWLPLLPYHALAAGPALAWNAWSSWSLSLPALAMAEISLAVGAGFWLYGLGLTALFGLVTPAMLVEGKGLVPALRRSAALLGAGRWRFVGLSILMDFVGAVPAAFGAVVVAFVVTRIHFGPNATALAQMQGYYLIEGVVTALLASLVTALWLVIVAVSYREFRRLREGAPHDQLAQIFA